MRKVILITTILFLFTGCQSPALTATGGAVAGFAASETFKGAKADLQKREDALVQAWNLGIEQGVDIETLDQLQKEIEQTRIIRESVETGETLLSVDWSNPKEAGASIGLVAATILAYLNRRKLKNVMAGVHKFEGSHDSKLAEELHNDIKGKCAKLPS